MIEKRKLLYGKRGNVFTESLIYIVSIFIIVLVMFFAVKLFKGINPTLQAQDTINAQSKEMLNKVDTNMPILFNNLILMLIILLWITVIVLSFIIDSHPIFFIIGIFLLLVSLTVGLMLGNVYNDLIQSGAFDDVRDSFTFSTWFFTHMHIVMVLVGASILIALYVKSQYQGGGF